MVTARFSQNKRAIEERIHRLPTLMIDQMKARAKRDATAVVENFKTGISEDKLKLERLKPGTVKSKAGRALEHPDHPLYGLGYDEPDSYVNALEVVNVGERLWAVRPREAWHHGKSEPEDQREQKIRLKDLFNVHEYGAMITNAFGRGITVRIPPRPALRYAYRAYMAERAKADPSVKMRAAIAKHVQTGNRAALDQIRAKLARGEEP